MHVDNPAKTNNHQRKPLKADFRNKQSKKEPDSNRKAAQKQNSRKHLLNP